MPHHDRPHRRTASLVVGVVGALGLLVGTAGPAGAHVSIHPATAPRGSFSILSFAVPDERADAATTSVEVVFPTDRPIPFVSVQPVPGWTATVERTTLAEPLATEDGSVSEVVSRVVWSGGRIEPGEFQQFTVSAGPLPTTGRRVVFKALQTYSSGDVVRWIATPAKGAPEPEHPAPVLRLSTATRGH